MKKTTIKYCLICFFFKRLQTIKTNTNQAIIVVCLYSIVKWSRNLSLKWKTLMIMIIKVQMKCRRAITKYVSLGKLLKIGWKYWQAKLQLEKFKMNIFDDLSEPNANSEHFLFLQKSRKLTFSNNISFSTQNFILVIFCHQFFFVIRAPLQYLAMYMFNTKLCSHF